MRDERRVFSRYTVLGTTNETRHPGSQKRFVLTSAAILGGIVLVVCLYQAAERPGRGAVLEDASDTGEVKVSGGNRVPVQDENMYNIFDPNMAHALASSLTSSRVRQLVYEGTLALKGTVPPLTICLPFPSRV